MLFQLELNDNSNKSASGTVKKNEWAILFFLLLFYFIIQWQKPMQRRGRGVSQPWQEKEKRKKKERTIIGRKERISGVKFITMLTMVNSGEIS